MASLFGLGTKPTPDPQPNNAVARYVCVKHSWRGKYSRILVFSAGEVTTLDPAEFKLTNRYSLSGGDPDVDGLTLGGGSDEDGEIIISARGEKKSKFSTSKYTVRGRAQCMTDLMQCVAAAMALARSAAFSKLLGTPDNFVGSWFSEASGEWLHATLRVTCYSIEVLPRDGDGDPLFRCDYVSMASPAFVLLGMAGVTAVAPHPTPGDSGGGADGAPLRSPRSSESSSMAHPPDAAPAFGVLCRHSPHAPALLATRQREALLASCRHQAEKRLGLMLVVDTSHGALPPEQLLTSARRHTVGASGGLPIGEWPASRLGARHELGQPLLALEPSLLGRPSAPPSAQPNVLQALGVIPGAHLSSRLVAVTSTHFLERAPSIGYELLGSAALTAVAAVVRFLDDPRLLGVEWVAGGAPPALFASDARDAIAAALLAAAQAASGRPIPLLAGLTAPADPLSGVVTDLSQLAWPTKEGSRGSFTAGSAGFTAAAAVAAAAAGAATGSGFVRRSVAAAHEAEVERWQLEQLAARAKAAAPDIQAARAAMPRTRKSAVGAPQVGSPAATAAAAAAGGMLAIEAPPASAAVTATIVEAPPASPGAKTGAGRSEAIELFIEGVFEFNAVVPYGGLAPGLLPYPQLNPAALGALLGLLPRDVVSHLPPDEAKLVVAVLQCMQRLASHPETASALMFVPGAVDTLFAAYGCGVDAVVCEAARLMLRMFAPSAARTGTQPWALLESGPPVTGAAAAASAASVEPTNEDLGLSKASKSMCFGGAPGAPESAAFLAARVSQLLSPLARLSRASAGAQPRGDKSSGGAQATQQAGGIKPPSAPTVMAVLEVVCSIVCEPWSVLTEGKLLDKVLLECSAIGRPLFQLFHHPAPVVSDGAALLMAAVAGAGPGAAGPMREAALSEGAVLQHLRRALFATGPQATLSRQLVSVWCDDHAPSLALLRRTLPPGLIRFLGTPRADGSSAKQHGQGVQQGQGAGKDTGKGEAKGKWKKVKEQLAQAAHAKEVAQAKELAQAQARAQAQAQQLAKQQQEAQLAADHEQQQLAQGAPVGAAAGGAVPGASAPAPATPGGAAVTGVAAPPAPSSAHPTAAPLPSTEPQPQQQQQPQQAPPPSPQQGPAQPQPQPVVTHGTPAARVQGLRGNWPALWAAALRDHRHAGLIWNAATRQDLREALEREEAALRGCTSTQAPVWNHAEFSVSYESSLGGHLCVAGVYVALLLDGLDADAVSKFTNARELCVSLHHTHSCCYRCC
ncbi:hypothetical protein FOA52_015532 [Chlamydomonas sp. UWO 241]|nr:hypothetical protein FOA52_015532 [Chlamydomonas sp. UWO 241]